MSTKQTLRVASVRTDGGTQSRGSLNKGVIEEYADHLAAGGTFPRITVFYDGENHWMSDGYHRHAAHVKVELKTIDCDVQKGSLRDAILHACGSNQTHGLRRSQADKRAAVILLLDDEEWNKWSDRQISKICGVSNTLVGTIRKEWARDLSVNIDRCAEPRTVQRGDQSYPMDTENIGQTAVSEAVSEPVEGNGKPPASRKRKQSPEQPKTRFDDREIDDAIGSLIRKFDERSRIHGKGPKHQACIDAMGDVLECWNDWRSGE